MYWVFFSVNLTKNVEVINVFSWFGFFGAEDTSMYQVLS